MRYLVILISSTQTRRHVSFQNNDFTEHGLFYLIYVSKGLTASEGLNLPAGIKLNHFNDIFTKPCIGASASWYLSEYLFSIGNSEFTHSPI